MKRKQVQQMLVDAFQPGVKRTFKQMEACKASELSAQDMSHGDELSEQVQAVDNQVVWAKLNSITKQTVSSTRMKGVEFSVGRHPENDLHITDARLSGFHCRIRRSCNPETGAMEILLEDLSTNGTYKNGHKIGNGESVPLKNGDEIHLLVEDKSAGITYAEEIGMIFVVLQDMSKPIKKATSPMKKEISLPMRNDQNQPSEPVMKLQEQETKCTEIVFNDEVYNPESGSSCSQDSKVEKALIKDQPVQDPSLLKRARLEEDQAKKEAAQKLEASEGFIRNLVEELECGICCELMHEPVLLNPCQHLNCGGCLSDWFKKEKVCPTCRVPLQSVFKSFKHNNLVEMVLEYKPNLKRDALIIAQLNATNMFKTDKYEVVADSKLSQVKSLAQNLQNRAPANKLNINTPSSSSSSDKSSESSSDDSSDSDIAPIVKQPIVRKQTIAQKPPQRASPLKARAKVNRAKTIPKPKPASPSSSSSDSSNSCEDSISDKSDGTKIKAEEWAVFQNRQVVKPGRGRGVVRVQRGGAAVPRAARGRAAPAGRKAK